MFSSVMVFRGGEETQVPRTRAAIRVCCCRVRMSGREWLLKRSARHRAGQRRVQQRHSKRRLIQPSRKGQELKPQKRRAVRWLQWKPKDRSLLHLAPQQARRWARERWGRRPWGPEEME